MAPLPELADDLLGEILLRLPPDDPGCLLRASLACKRWRRILADPAFRRRHRELHPTPLVLGFLRVVSDRVPYASRFVSIDPASRRPAARDLPGWLVLDCRHGRALFATPSPGPGTEVALDFVVWDPLTDERRRLPPSSPRPTVITHFNAAVLCSAAAGGCDHRGCHGGPFRVVFLVTARQGIHVTSARVYSSETGDWSELSNEHPYACIRHNPFPSALVGDTLYFCDDWANVFEFQLGAQPLSLSVIHRPPKANCIGIVISLMSEENGGLGSLGFASLEEESCLHLCLWSRETAHDGVARWAWRAIDLEKLLPDGTLPPPRLASDRPQLPIAFVVGFAEGTGTFFVQVRTHGDVYMVQPSSGRARKVSEGYRNYLFPYTSFCIPVTGAASTSEEPREGAPSA